MKARVSNLHKTEAEWQKLKDWKPEAGELVVYDPDEHFEYARIKMGDGVRTLQELEFLVDKATLNILKNLKHSEILDGGRITEYKE